MITGADSGIGRAVAIAYAREGADVLVSYLNEQEDDEDTARWVREAGRQALLVPRRHRRWRRDCRQLVERTVRELGRLDILVNNAAYPGDLPSLDEISAEEFVADLPDQHLRHVLSLEGRAAADAARQPIINRPRSRPTSLGRADTLRLHEGGNPQLHEGLPMMTQHSVRVNTVAPGPVWTPLIPSSLPNEKVERFGANTVFARPAQPAELAPAFVLLASAESSYMTGETIPVTGGRPFI